MKQPSVMVPSGDVVSFHAEVLTIVDPMFSKRLFPFLFKGIQFVERLRVESISRTNKIVGSSDQPGYILEG